MLAKVTGALVLLIAGLLLFGEVTARALGVADVPTFAPDKRVGYYPRPNQAGRVLDRNRWVFNDRGMGVAEPFRVSPASVLLVGDSVVYGGAPLDQAVHIAPLLSKASSRPVWPVAAGGWALENELQMLNANPDLLRVPTIVWVSNTGDFGAENAWTNPVQYPSHHPISALLYGLRRTVLKPRDVVDSPSGPDATRRWQADLRRFLNEYHGRIIWVLYPKKSELGQRSSKFDGLLQILGRRAVIVEPGLAGGWGPDNYRDPIHPNAEGDRVLAGLIAKALESPG